LPGSTRLAIGRPWLSVGSKLKSVSSLFNRKPPGAPVTLTIWREPNCASMVVVMASALPSASTMLMWDVPCSGWSAIGAALLRTPSGSPGRATCMLCSPIRLALWRRYDGASRLDQAPAGGATKSGSATYWARSANASRAASVYRCSQSADGASEEVPGMPPIPGTGGKSAASVRPRMPRIWPIAIAPEPGGGKPQMR
jgi:hypothetical protein